MYKYILKQSIKNEIKEIMVFSNQHYTPAGFKKLVKQVIKDIKEDGIETLESKVDIIKRELINNHDFISCTDNEISCNVTDL